MYNSMTIGSIHTFINHYPYYPYPLATPLINHQPHDITFEKTLIYVSLTCQRPLHALCECRFNISIYFNTFVSSEYVNLDKFMTIQQKNVWFVNNIFVARSDVAVFDGASGGINFLGNTYTSTDGTLGASFVTDHDLVETEIIEADPLLEKNNEGSYYVPGANRCVQYPNTSDMTYLLNNLFYAITTTLSLSSSFVIGNAASWPESTNTINVFDVPFIDDDPYALLDITGRARPLTQVTSPVKTNRAHSTIPVKFIHSILLVQSITDMILFNTSTYSET